MNRLEPNTLLAISTAVALALLLTTASVFGAPGNGLKYVIVAVVCSVLFVSLNGWMLRLMKRPAPQPMIRADAPSTAAWASLFPLLVMIAAAIPVFFPGHDYGLLVLIAAIWFAVTADSAIRAQRQG